MMALYKNLIKTTFITSENDNISDRNADCRCVEKTLRLTIFGHSKYFNCTTVTTGMCVCVCVCVCVLVGTLLNSRLWQ